MFGGLYSSFRTIKSYRVSGARQYELTNHLGNVLATISDRKIPDRSKLVLHYAFFDADVITATEYYPYGMIMPGRNYSCGLYRYGFNSGSEKEDDIYGEDNLYTTEFRELDTRLCRWWSPDPVFKPWESPYASFANNPIWYTDPDGLNPDNGGDPVRITDWEQCVVECSGEGATLKTVVIIDSRKTNDSGVAHTSVSSSKESTGFWGNLWGNVKSGCAAVGSFLNKMGQDIWNNPLDYVPFVGSAKMIYEGIRDGDWKKAGGGLLCLGADIYGGSLLRGIGKAGMEIVGKTVLETAVESEAKSLAVSGAEHVAEREANSVAKEASVIPVVAAKGGDKVKYIGRIDDLKGIPRSQTLLDDLPNLGSPKANYYQNMSVLRKALRDGYTIKDASWFRPNSELAETLLNPNRTVGQTFLGAERNLLKNRGLWP